MQLSISRYMNSICICHFLLYEKAKKFINMLKKERNRKTDFLFPGGLAGLH